MDLDIQSLMQKAQEMQSKMKEMQDEAKKQNVTVESGAGMVKLTIDGEGYIKNLELDKTIINPDDPKMLQDLIIAAMNQARNEMNDKLSNSMSGELGDLKSMMPNIPGFGA